MPMQSPNPCPLQGLLDVTRREVFGKIQSLSCFKRLWLTKILRVSYTQAIEV